MADFPALVNSGDPGHISHHDLLATLFSLTNTQGTLAQRPPAGTARRTFFASDTNQWFRDDGSNWHQIATPDATTTWTAAQTFNGAASFAGATTVSDKTSSTNVGLRSATSDVQYVTATGNDANDGRTWGSAKATLAGAQTAIPSGRGRVYVGAGIFTFSSTVDLASGLTYIGMGNGDHNFTPPTKLSFTGSGPAFRMGTGASNRSYSGLRDFMLVTGASCTAALEIIDSGGTDAGTFENIRMEGVGGVGYGIYMHGQGGCSCLHAFKTISIYQYSTGLKLSGSSNANLFENLWFGQCTTWAIDISGNGTDTLGGQDNVFMRVEMAGGVPNGVNLANNGSRNQFFKMTQDGAGTTVALADASHFNQFYGCTWGPGTFSSSTDSQHFGTSGGTVPAGYLNYLGGATFAGAVNMNDLANIVLGTANGTMLGTTATQKLGFWGRGPVVRPTGWAAATGTPTRTTFVTGSVTLSVLAEHVKALIDDLIAVGLIGA